MNATYTSAGKLLFSIFQTKLDLVLRNILRKSVGCYWVEHDGPETMLFDKEIKLTKLRWHAQQVSFRLIRIVIKKGNTITVVGHRQRCTLLHI